jgi:ribonuclease Z
VTTLITIGTGAALGEDGRNPTMLAVRSGRGGVVLVDCGGNAGPEVLRAGIKPSEVEGLIVTHRHPDHVGGLLSLLQVGLLGDGFSPGARGKLRVFSLPDTE